MVLRLLLLLLLLLKTRLHEDLNDENKNANMCSIVRILVKMLANVGKPCQHLEFAKMLVKMLPCV